MSANIFHYFGWDENNPILLGGLLAMIYPGGFLLILVSGVQGPQGGVIFHPAGPHQEPE